MSSTAETEPSPTRTGLAAKTLGRRSRRKKQEPPSAWNSTASVDGPLESHGRLRSSIDAAVEKIRPGAASGGPDPDEKPKGESRGLGGLLRRTKRKSKSKRIAAVKAEEVERGRTVSQRGSLEDPIESSRSSTHLKDAGPSEDDNSSLITDDSETESPGAVPPLTTRQSHAGYLTLSSPLMRPASTDPKVEPQSSPAHSSNPASTASTSEQPGTPNNTVSTTSRRRDHDETAPTSGSMSPSKGRETGSVGRKPGEVSQDAREKLGPQGTGDAPSITRPLQAAHPSPPSASAVAQATVPRGQPQAETLGSPLGRLDTVLATPPRSPGTPLTTVTPPTPSDTHPVSPINARSAVPYSQGPAGKLRKTNTETVGPSGGHPVVHRRVQSASSGAHPSRLSHNAPAPLTPTIEEPRSASDSPVLSGGNATQGGFFSSVFSAAQNAASTLSNSIANTSLATGNRGKSADDSRFRSSKAEESGVVLAATERETRGGAADDEPKEQRTLAVETLGMGDLSLSHLGIAVEPTPDGRGLPPVGGGDAPLRGRSAGVGNGAERPRSAPRAKNGDGATTVPIVDAMSDKAAPAGSKTDPAGGDSSGTPVVGDPVPGLPRPRSMHEAGFVDGPPTVSDSAERESESGLKRGGSVRSRIDSTVRRKREGSSATGTTVATAAGTTGTTATPISPGTVPRLTGFAVASKKRNRDFHQLFKSVPEDDWLIEDYSAAIQKDILLHGRLYVSENHICFNSNIFGYVTTLVIGFDEVVSVEKKNTAMLFPNAIVIQTLHARNIFASLASRESTYDLIVGIWKISHPNLRSSLNGVQLEEAGGGDKTVKAEGSSTDGHAEEEDDDEEAVYDEDAEEEEGIGSFTEAGDGSVIGSEPGDVAGKPTARKVSAGLSAGKGARNDAPAAGGDTKGDKSAAAVAPGSTVDFPGPATHRPTECGDQDKHFDRLIRDEVVAAPLGKVYSLIFGPNSGVFMTTWLHDEQKVLDLQLDDDRTGLTESNRSRTYSYIKPLNAAIGPKQTKCIITETVDAIDLEKAVSVTIVTQSPDVPNGNIFSVRTKYCLMWAEGNGTRVWVTCTVDWTGKSWIKGPIEKGANDGQVTYVKDLLNAVRLAASVKASTSASGVKGRVKRRKKEIAEISAEAVGKPAPVVVMSYGGQERPGSQHWGFLEPLRQPLSPVVDLVKPLMTSQMAIGLMAFLLLLTWLRPDRDPYSRRAAAGPGFPGLLTSERYAAYEEIWRKEESGLWEWLDERVGVDRLASSRSSTGRSDTPAAAAPERPQIRSPAHLDSTMVQERMTEQQMAEAIRTTQQRLDELKRIVEQRRRASAPPPPSPPGDDSEGGVSA